MPWRSSRRSSGSRPPPPPRPAGGAPLSPPPPRAGARADPRRRAEDAFIDTIYAPSSPYHRSSAGVTETVERLDAATSRAELARRFAPPRVTLILRGGPARR